MHLSTKVDAECEDWHTQNLIKASKGVSEDIRLLKLMHAKPKKLDKIGIPPLKQVDLFIKWRKMVPDEYKDVTCPRPTDDIILKVKQNVQDKANRLKELNQNSILDESDSDGVTENAARKMRRKSTHENHQEKRNKTALEKPKQKIHTNLKSVEDRLKLQSVNFQGRGKHILPKKKEIKQRVKKEKNPFARNKSIRRQ